MEKKILGDYNIIKQIGQGPLGAVYLAEHRFIKRHFALKVLPEELSTDRSFIQRFERQIATLASLEHPHIVKVHNISYADGIYFIVNDCIVDQMGETTNLGHYLSLNERRLPEEEIFDILMQVAEALDYGHSKMLEGKTLAHRGIKLSNILLGKSQERPSVFLSDFGLSPIIGEGLLLTKSYKMMAQSLSIDLGQDKNSPKSDKYPTDNPPPSKLSKLHLSFLQNYYFMAPEQKDIGRIDQVDMKCDVWAFGVLCYYLIMKTFPEGHFPMPSAFMRDFKCDWDRLITRTLNPDPLKRPALLVTELKAIRHKEEEPIPTPPAPKPQENLYATTPSDYSQEREAPPSYDQKSVLHYEEKKEVATATLEKTEEAEAPEGSVMKSIPSFFKVTRPTYSEKPVEEQPKPILNPQEIERPTYEPDPSKIFQVESTVALYKPKEMEIKDIEPLLTDMVIIEGGEYMRGSNEGVRDERPMHRVLLSSFALDIHPITNEQFVRFLEAMGGEKDSNNNDIIRLRESRIKRFGGKLIIESGYAKHPVVGVSWYGAVAYAKWVGKRLPTEAEWEIASRGGLSENIYPTGDTIDRTQANYFSADTTSVMSYPPTHLGLYDMAGNVYEWCQDWYDYHYYESSSQEPENPMGPLQGVYRVLRGGCWKSLKDDLRCAHRHRNNPGTVNKTYGFRCAADVS